jgi:hypothetical protein
MSRDTKLWRERLSRNPAAFHARSHGEKPGLGRFAAAHRQGEERDPGANRARVEAMDRAYSRHHQAPPARRNLGAANIQITADDLAEIQRAAAEIHVEGERYPQQLMAANAVAERGPRAWRPWRWEPALRAISSSGPR